MTILGIDPGTARTGYGILKRESGLPLQCVTYGCIETPKEESAQRRLLLLDQRLQSILAEHQPDVVGVERLFFFRNLTTALPVSEARGVILLSAAKANLPVLEFTPMQIKMAIGGYGKAEKKQIQRMVQEILGLDDIPKPDDAADALGVAIACSLAGMGYTKD